MRLGLAVLAVAVFAGCGRGEGGDAALIEVADEQAREQAAEALQAVDALEERAEVLEQRVDSLRDGRAAFRRRLDKATKRLWASLSNLRQAVAEARAAGDSAASEVDAALAEAGAATRALAVLENRFDYHLARHGGG